MDTNTNLDVHTWNVGDDKHADALLDCYVLHGDVFEKAE